LPEREREREREREQSIAGAVQLFPRDATRRAGYIDIADTIFRASVSFPRYLDAVHTIDMNTMNIDLSVTSIKFEISTAVKSVERIATRICESHYRALLALLKLDIAATIAATRKVYRRSFTRRSARTMILVETHPIRTATFGCCLARDVCRDCGEPRRYYWAHLLVRCFGIDSSSKVENALGNRQGVKISGWKREGRRETRAPAPARARRARPRSRPRALANREGTGNGI